MRLLVVEDEVDLAEAIAVGVRREGYAVDVQALVREREALVVRHQTGSGSPATTSSRST